MRIFIAILFLLASIPTFSQQIHGIIQNKSGEPLPAMVVALKNAEDSTFIVGAISKENGQFDIAYKQADKKYILELSGLGYHTKQITVGSISAQLENLVVTLDEDTQELNQITVVGKRKVAYRNGEYRLVVSGTSLEKQPDIFSVMQFLPFVTTNKENISIMGKGSILIMLNGRQVRSMAEISRLTPSQIKELTVVPHASSEYGADYDAVIKIKTVTDIKDFLSSQVNHTSVFARDYSNSQTVDVNFKKGKWNSFGSYTFKHLSSVERATNKYTIYDADNQEVLGNNSSVNRAGSLSNNHNLILSSSYSFGPNNSLELQYMFDSNRAMNNTDVTEASSFSNNDDVTLNTLQDNTNNSTTHDVVLKYLLAAQSYSLTINGGYINSVSHTDNNITDGMAPYAYIKGRNNYNVYTFNADYAKQLSPACKIQLGTKHSYITNNGYSLANYNAQQDLGYDNNTRLHDGVSAAYVSVSGQVKKLYYAASLRGEYAFIRYQDNSDTPIKRNDFNLFPSLSFTYSASPYLVVSGGYVMKGVRPSFSQISPLIRYVNSHLYEQGTPSLQHTISHNPYLTMIIRSKISVDINYFHKTNFAMYVFGQITPQSNILVNKPINVDVNYWNLRASYSDKLGIYRFAYNGEIHYDQTRIPFLGNSGLANKPRFSASLVNQFDASANLMFFCNLDLASSYTSLRSKFSDAYNVTLGAYATFFKDKRLTLIISGNDLVRQGVPNNSSSHYYVSSVRTFSPDSRNLMVSLRYNINSYRALFRKNNSNADEYQRIK